MASPSNKLHRLGGLCSIFAVIAGCTLAAIPTTLFIPLPLTLAFTRRFQRERRLRKLHRMVEWARFCVRRILRIKLTVLGKEHLPEETRGHLFVCNHQSGADIPVLMSALGTGAFVAKKWARYYPILGACAWGAGSIFLERDDKRSRVRALKDVLRMARDSVGVILFPEGTRSRDRTLKRKVAPGAIRLAYTRHLKIVPVAVDGTFDVSPPSNDRVIFGQPVVVNVGQAMDPKDWADAKSWTDAVWSAVCALHAEGHHHLRGTTARTDGRTEGLARPADPHPSLQEDA